DAQLFADHAHHKDVLVSDVKLAIETRASLDFTLPPSRQALVALAAKKNAIALPFPQEKFGLRLPPERHLLVKSNISIVPKKRTTQDLEMQDQFSMHATAPAPVPVHNFQPSAVFTGPPMPTLPMPTLNRPIHPSPLAQPLAPSSAVRSSAAADDDYDDE
ncbi:Transcription initiation factor TFIID subunit 9B, partial [Kappamyces sp. JEL0680]